MNKQDYAKLAAGGVLVAFGLWRRSVFGLVVGGIGGLILQRTLMPKRDENPEADELESSSKASPRTAPAEVEVFAVKHHEPPEQSSDEHQDAVNSRQKSGVAAAHDVHAADLASEADTLDDVHKA